MKREDFPKGFEDNSDFHFEIAEALLEQHLQDLFEFYETPEDINDWEFDDDALRSMVIGRYEKNS